MSEQGGLDSQLFSFREGKLAAGEMGRGVGSVLPGKKEVLSNFLCEEITKPQECKGSQGQAEHAGNHPFASARPPQSGRSEPDLLAPLF